MDSSTPNRFKFFGFQPGISLRRSAEGVISHAEAEAVLPSAAYVRKVAEGQFMGKLRVSIQGGAVEVHAQASSPRKVLKALDVRMHRKLGVGRDPEVLEVFEPTPSLGEEQ